MLQLQRQHAELQKESWDTESRKRKYEENLLGKEKKLRTKALVLEREKNSLISKDAHYKHALRKREMEYRRLQESLHKLVRGAVGKNITRTKILNEHKLKSTSNVSSAETSALLESGLLACESRLASITDENNLLKTSLKLLEQEVDSIIEPDLQRIDQTQGPNSRKSLYEVFSPSTQRALREFTTEHIDIQQFADIKHILEKSVKAKLELVRSNYQGLSVERKQEQEASRVRSFAKVSRNLFQIIPSDLETDNRENSDPKRDSMMSIKTVNRNPLSDITNSVPSPVISTTQARRFSTGT